MNLHKRNCCSTWIPRKIHMEFANDSRKKFLFVKNGRSWILGILINHDIYLLSYNLNAHFRYEMAGPMFHAMSEGILVAKS